MRSLAGLRADCAGLSGGSKTVMRHAVAVESRRGCRVKCVIGGQQKRQRPALSASASRGFTRLPAGWKIACVLGRAAGWCERAASGVGLCHWDRASERFEHRVDVAWLYRPVKESGELAGGCVGVGVLGGPHGSQTTPGRKRLSRKFLTASRSGTCSAPWPCTAPAFSGRDCALPGSADASPSRPAAAVTVRSLARDPGTDPP